MNLVLLERDELEGQGLATLTGTRAAHLLQVLKVRPGDSVRIGVLDGAVGTGRVVAASDGTVTLACALTDTPPLPRIDLLLALPRPKVLKRLWAQLAALGVGRIMLTNAARVERNYFDTHVLAPACYRPLLVEGLQQARDTRLPRVTIHRQFRVLVEDELDALSPDTTRIVADPTGTQRMQEAGRGAARVLLAIGPEGGWNDFELTLLAQHGFRRVGIGPRTLRTDTACIALIALANSAIEGTVQLKIGQSHN